MAKETSERGREGEKERMMVLAKRGWAAGVCACLCPSQWIVLVLPKLDVVSWALWNCRFFD